MKIVQDIINFFSGKKKLTVKVKRENAKQFSGLLSNGKKSLKFEISFPDSDLYPSDLLSFLRSATLKVDGLMYLNDTAEEIQTKRAFHNLILDFTSNLDPKCTEGTSEVFADKNHRFVTELGL